MTDISTFVCPPMQLTIRGRTFFWKRTLFDPDNHKHAIYQCQDCGEEIQRPVDRIRTILGQHVDDCTVPSKAETPAEPEETTVPAAS